jgi:hypothetical protein
VTQRNSESGVAMIDWLLATAVAAALAMILHGLLFPSMQRVFRWAIDCVAADGCDGL